MKKKCITFILALILVLLPTYVLAAEEATSTTYWMDISTKDAQQMLKSVYDGSENRRIVFVYYGTDGPSQTAVTQFSTYANDNKCYIYHYLTSENNSLENDLAPLFNNVVPTQLPVAITYNPTSKEYIAKENVMLNTSPLIPEINGLLNMMQESGIQNGGSTPPDSSSGDNTDNDNIDYTGSSGCSIANVTKYEWEVLRLVNQHRMELGTQPLSIFESLESAADTRSSELIEYLSHTRPDGSGYETVFSGIDWITHSENIASGQTSPSDVMNSWLHSPGHKANIERKNKLHIGIGYYYNENDTSYKFKHYWVQNFLSDKNCVLYDMKLSRNSIAGGGYNDLEQLLMANDIEILMKCPVHGICSMPLIAEMCTGYDPNAEENQTITVTYKDYQGVNLTANLTITTDLIDDVTEIEENHVHNWIEDTETDASCTENGIKTYTCSCDETKVDIISSAMGHSFIKDDINDTYICQNCDATINSALNDVYNSLKEQVDPKTSWTFNDNDSEAIKEFLENQITNILEENQSEKYTFEIQPLDRLIDKYQYRVIFHPISEEEVEVTKVEEIEDINTQYNDNEDLYELLNFTNPIQLHSSSSTKKDNNTILVTEILTLNLSNLTATDFDIEEPEPPVKPPVKPPVTPPATPSYIISVSANPTVGGNVTGGGNFDENTSVTVEATANKGYQFVRWTEDGKEVSTVASYTFTVTEKRTLIAEFVAEEETDTPSNSGSSSGRHSSSSKYISYNTYPPIVEQSNAGGTVSITPEKPNAGNKVTIKVNTNEGYIVEKIAATDQNNKPVTITISPDGTYTFIQPGSIVNIDVNYKLVDTSNETATDTPIDVSTNTSVEIPWYNPFSDIAENAWYYEAIQFVSVNGLMNGYNDGLFYPDDNLSRAELTQLIYNKENKPIVTDGNIFTDVASDQWYTPAITWAVTHDIVSGYGNGLFEPNNSITREQLAVVLWRYAGSPNTTNQALYFTDANEINSYALNAICWAIENGILNGYGNGVLAPQKPVTRAQMAQILKNFIEE